MTAARYLGTALGGALTQEFTGDEVIELWDAHAQDLRERDADGTITLWARGVDQPERIFAPVHFRPLDGEQAA